MSNYKTETKCIQSGYEPGNGEARVLPIYQSTTFRYTSSEQMGRLFDLEESGYFYTRLQNPTNDAVAAKICDLEGGVAAMLTSSGQAANFYAIMNIVEAGDHIVCASALYGGTYNLYAHTIKKMGVEATFVDPECTQEELDAEKEQQQAEWERIRQERRANSLATKKERLDAKFDGSVQSLKDFLDSYYSVEDRRDALSLIDEPLHLAASQFSYPITSEQAGVLLYLCGRAIDTDAIPRKTLYSLIEIVIKEERANATNC